MAMYRRTPLRFLAPVALIAFGIAFFQIVKSYSKDEGPTTPSASQQAKDRDLGVSGNPAAKTTNKKPKDSLPKKYYRVQENDSLSTIAGKVGIPLEKLQELNPNLDAQSLQTGQLVKLRE